MHGDAFRKYFPCESSVGPLAIRLQVEEGIIRE